MKVVLYRVVFCFLILVYSMKVFAMSLLFGTEVVLFSPMEGKITYKGAPAANAKIIVHLFWKNDVGEKETFYTNANGEFSIPIKKTKVRIPPLAEFVTSQQISVFYNEKEFDIWHKSLIDTDEYGGLGGYLKNVSCELTEESVRQEDFDGLFGTSCKWDAVQTDIKG